MIFIDYVLLDQHVIRVEAEIPAGEGPRILKMFSERGRRKRQLDPDKMRKTTLAIIQTIVDDDAAH